jgi:hypothetical protein
MTAVNRLPLINRERAAKWSNLICSLSDKEVEHQTFEIAAF